MVFFSFESWRGEEVGCEGRGRQKMERREKGVDEADFFVGNKGENEGDQDAGRCKLAFYSCREEWLGRRGMLGR